MRKTTKRITLIIAFFLLMTCSLAQIQSLFSGITSNTIVPQNDGIQVCYDSTEWIDG